MNNFIFFGFLMSLTFIQSAVGNCFNVPPPVNPVNQGLLTGVFN
ncbi:hypothetical protein Anas_09100 [Armadillidium nasatum]|uniref:Uncharacterized protein n=1 Tax=Armadillidium nasatum TaxID=96803 RepID=A0A5N5T2V9_9CRUS|nr:hypothetical protein Anas_09100 [Armadillidium nasatum]